MSKKAKSIGTSNPWKPVALAAIAVTFISIVIFAYFTYASATLQKQQNIIRVTKLVYITAPPPTKTITPTVSPTVTASPTPVPTQLSEDAKYNWEWNDLSNYQVSGQLIYRTNGYQGWCQGIQFIKYKAVGAVCYTTYEQFQKKKLPDGALMDRLHSFAKQLNISEIGTLDLLPEGRTLAGFNILENLSNLLDLNVYYLIIDQPAKGSKLHLLTSDEDVALNYMDWTPQPTIWNIGSQIYYEIPLFSKQKLSPIFGGGVQLKSSVLSGDTKKLKDTFYLLEVTTQAGSTYYLAPAELNKLQKDMDVLFDIYEK